MSNHYIVWHRRDLRIHDNAALRAAAQRGCVQPAFVFDPFFYTQHIFFDDRLLFLFESLRDLENQYAQFDIKLRYLFGNPLDELQKLRMQLKAEVFFNYDTNGVYGMQRDAIAEKLGFIGFTNDAIQRSGRAENRSYNIKEFFTQAIPPLTFLRPVVHSIPSYVDTYTMQSKYQIKSKKLVFEKGGSSQAWRRLEEFMQNFNIYPGSIAKPALAETGTSRLSTHFSFGTISI